MYGQGQVLELQKLFYDGLVAKIGQGARFTGGQAYKEFKRLLNGNEPGILAKTVADFFKSTDPFIVSNGYHFGIYAQKFNALKVSGPLINPGRSVGGNGEREGLRSLHNRIKEQQEREDRNG